MSAKICLVTPAAPTTIDACSSSSQQRDLWQVRQLCQVRAFGELCAGKPRPSGSGEKEREKEERRGRSGEEKRK